MINFENLPSRKTPINNVNLNKLQKDILETLNPIGTIRMQTTNTNPRTYLGFGTWVLWGSGRVPVGVDTAQTEFSTVEKVGGNKESYVDISMGASYIYYKETNKSFQANKRKFIQTDIEENISQRSNSINLGTNNCQPYITCYMWKRTA